MRVTVRLFARLREMAGTAELVLELVPPATIGTVWTELAARHPGIEPYASSVSAARNLEYARFDTALSNGDEVAFLPPVSGGAPRTRGQMSV
jgi:molybdopterin converting factor subunit 1